MKPYYSPEHLQRIPDLMKVSPEAAASYLHFEKQVYQTAHALPQKTKELIAIATAHVAGCPYCIDVHVKKYKALGGTMEEIVEALLLRQQPEPERSSATASTRCSPMKKKMLMRLSTDLKMVPSVFVKNSPLPYTNKPDREK